MPTLRSYLLIPLREALSGDTRNGCQVANEISGPDVINMFFRVLGQMRFILIHLFPAVTLFLV